MGVLGWALSTHHSHWLCFWGQLQTEVKGCLAVFSGLTVILSLKCKFDFLTYVCDNVLLLKRCNNQASFWCQTLLKQMVIILSREAKSYSRLTVGEYTFCMCMFFKYKKFRFFGVFWVNVCLSFDIQISPFHVTSWPEPENEDICEDNAGGWVKILQSKSRGSCWHPQSLHEGICKRYQYMMCSRFRWNQWFQWHFEVCLILYGWNLVLCVCVPVDRYCCMSQYCLNWRIWVTLKML